MFRGCIGVDVGGTNTDAVILVNRDVRASFKAPTTSDVTTGVRQALAAVIRHVRQTEPKLQIVQVNIGTTHFVNAVLQRQNLARVSVIRLCGTASRAVPPFGDFPDGLSKTIRGGVYMVSGGNQYDGQEISSLDDQEIRKCAEDSWGKGFHHFVISGVFSPVDSGQELKAADLLRDSFPEASITLSHEIGHIGLLERENAAILNESLKDLCQRTIKGLEAVLVGLGLDCPFYLTQNDGTIMSSKDAIRFPVTTFAAGPTNSMRGAAFLSDEKDGIVVDIGGTSTDVGALLHGFPREASSYVEVGGVRTNFRMPDVFCIGLGGGSHVHSSIDDGKQVVKVGPLSTGYRLRKEGLVFGGKIFTATDAAVAVGLADCGDRSLVRDRFGDGIATIAKIRQMVENCIDQVKITQGNVPVILVGGGSILVDETCDLQGASKLVKPPHFDVANAIGAALSQVSGCVDYVVSLLGMIGEEKYESKLALARKSVSDDAPDDAKMLAVEKAKVAMLAETTAKAKRQAEEKAKAVALKFGAHPSTLQLVEVVDIPLAYVPGHACRIKAKVVGDLSQDDRQSSGVVVENLNVDDHEEDIPDRATEEENLPGQAIPDSEESIFTQTYNPSTIKPTIDPHSGEWILSEYDIECICKGAGIVGCGGGGSPHVGKVMALKTLREGKYIRVITPERWIARSDPDRDFVTPIEFMGAPLIGIEKLESGTECRAALGCMETLLNIDYSDDSVVETFENCRVETGFNCKFCNNFPSEPNRMQERRKRITALMSGEIGGQNAVEALILGGNIGLPVIDCDGMGRAFPELQMYTPFIYGKQPYPATLADDKGQTAVILQADTPKDLENHLRTVCTEMGCQAALSCPPLQPAELMKMVVPYSLSRVWHLGQAVLEARWAKTSPVDTIIEHQNGKLLTIGKIVAVHRETTGGFNRGVITIEGLAEFANQVLEIDFQNENLIARSGSPQKILACTPDLITCVDTETGEAIMTEEVRYGLRVTVLALPSCPQLRTEVALDVVGPRAFQYNDVTFVPLGEYIDHGPVSMK